MKNNINQQEFFDQNFKNTAYNKQNLIEHRFVSCTFLRCTFRETKFEHCAFEDCSFIKCDLSLAILNNCIFQNTRFEDCQIVGVNWMDTNLRLDKFQLIKTIGFDKCTLNHCTFLGLNLKNIQLTHCTAHDVSFEEADLSGADCRWTDFSESRFLNTNLTGSDFTGASQYQISVGNNIIKKARFSLPEAMNLLNGLDIILVDDNNLDP